MASSSISSPLCYTVSQAYLPLQCFFIDLSRLKDENHWWAGASDYLFCEIGHKVVQYPGSSGTFRDAPEKYKTDHRFLDAGRLLS